MAMPEQVPHAVAVEPHRVRLAFVFGEAVDEFDDGVEIGGNGWANRHAAIVRHHAVPPAPSRFAARRRIVAVMATLSDVRDRVRKDLRDTDAGSYRWSDAQLDRRPRLGDSARRCREQKATSRPSPGAAKFLAGLDVFEIAAVECPLGNTRCRTPYSSYRVALPPFDEPPTGANLVPARATP
jgi:hypothetical protein